MKEIKLKECPCCGGKAKIEYRLNFTTKQVRITCSKCNLSTEWVDESVDYCAKEAVAKVWNKREGKELRCPSCGEEGIHMTTIHYIPDKVRAQIHCDVCGTDMDIPDISKCVGELSELVHNG